jgi:hypothetical protein
LIRSTLVLLSILIPFALAFGLFLFAIANLNPAFGQELLPEAGTNETLGVPTTNVTGDEDTDTPIAQQQKPGSLLDPFFGR